MFFFFQSEQITFLCILFAMIIIGNCLVIVSISLSKNRRSRMNFFILNLAIADISAGLVNVLTDIIWKSTIDWHGGNVGCKLVRYAQGVVTYGATFALVALSIDRLDAIARPLKFSGKTRSKILVSLAWGCALTFSVPMLVINERIIVDGRPQCWIEFPEAWYWKLYITIIAIGLFIIPAVLIAVCYIIIVVILWRKTSLQVPNSVTSEKRYITNSSYISSRSNRNNRKKEMLTACSSRGLIPKAKLKTIKMTLVIVLVFIICWSPYFVFDLLDVYHHLPSDQQTVAISTFIQSLAPLNSAANPIIYFLFNTKMCFYLLRYRPKHQGSPMSNTHLTSI
ncbi:cardioacceleratory peptide receptor-like [Patella vulgata]|uniref:cardioacceleratory peptide receptor-like n=1 Tax=Patella vulgata TaxID=6465 RepID=UPI00217F5AFC|nr:cardioacceleratory peptide receptor-like [Patella vulgata]